METAVRWRVVDEQANEFHRRAEVQRRAMMTRAQRDEADYVLEVERVTQAGRRAAGERAFAVGLVGFFVALLFGTISGWLFLPALAGGLWLARLVFTLRMGELERELSNMPAPWDRDSR